MKLLIPGPVEVREEILQVMSEQLIPHRSKEASRIQKSIEDKMKIIWNTNKDILCSTSSGTGLMEGAVKSCTLKRAAIFSIGGFGDKWYEIAKKNGIEADLYKSKEGEPTTKEQIEEALSKGIYDLITITHNETSTGVQNNLEELSSIYKKYDDVVVCVDTVSSAGGVNVDVDKYNIDIAITSTQKCLGLPPGMAFCTFSEKARKRAEKVKNRGAYLDLINLYNFMEESHQYPSTPNMSLMRATEKQLDYIVNVEGLENRIKRHKEMAIIVRKWAKEHGGLFANEDYLSDTLTTIKIKDEKVFEILAEEMLKRGYLLGSGYGHLKDKNFRMAHMADRSIEELNEALRNLSEIWDEKIK